MWEPLIESLPPERPVLIAGPTAAGKSALALAIAEAQGGVIVNADALQVYENWRLLTARPSPEDEARAAHALYGHVARGQAYSVGRWLRELAPLLKAGPRPILVGGSGLYFTALTEGLAEIPPVPANARAEAGPGRRPAGPQALAAGIDAPTLARIDRRNPARLLRAWEVRAATGRGLAWWQARTGPPLLALESCSALVIEAGRDWLAARIARRFERMLAEGALEEARANLDGWDPALPSARAIGAGELIAHLRGESSLQEARARAIIASRQYAKRQRSWFRARMRAWRPVRLP